MSLAALVLALAPASDPTATVVGRSVPYGLFALHQSGPWTVWVTSEAQEGGQDLDGDGQTLSTVLFVRDDRTGEVTNLQRAVSSRTTQVTPVPKTDYLLTVSGSFVLAAVVEDTTQLGLQYPEAWFHLVHLPTGASVAPGLRSSVYAAMTARGDVAAFVVPESANGDLNGDGDALDDVVHVWSAPHGAVVNTGLAGIPSVEGRALLVSVSEAAQGGSDLNGDGDALDAVLFHFDVPDSVATNLGRAGWTVPCARRTGLVAVGEAMQGADLDGDGALDDFVYHVLEPEGPSLRNLGLALPPTFPPYGPQNPIPFAPSDRDLVALVVQGDGGPGAGTTVLWSTVDRAPCPTGTAGWPVGLWLDPRSDAPVLAFSTSEELYGLDANGNGTVDDPVVGLWRAEPRGVELLPWGGYAPIPGPLTGPATSGPVVQIVVLESEQGVDLDGDGLLTGLVTVLHDARDGDELLLADVTTSFVRIPALTGRRAFAIGPAGLRAVALDSFAETDLGVDLQVCGPGFCIPYPEAYDGGRAAGVVYELVDGLDLNGDGDAFDLVLTVAR